MLTTRQEEALHSYLEKMALKQSLADVQARLDARTRERDDKDEVLDAFTLLCGQQSDRVAKLERRLAALEGS